ncbi:MAG: thioredoxin-disulfide reductase [Candidatus Obscuribacterales bacterium]|nr:thioredoxin-disulfide reductase [Candidatus Obscuribacterales bacterium]
MALTTKLAILGGGPAGLTAAIYAARGQLNPIVIEGVSSGGQLMTTSEVENFPGFPDGVQGPELMENMRKQALRFGTVFVSENAHTVRLGSRPFAIVTDAQEILAETLIITTGARSRSIGIASERTLMGRGVSVCATCDGFFFRGKDVAVVGGGDAAMEEAVFLTRFAKSVTVIHRRDKFRASPIMLKRAQDNAKIKFVLDSVVEEILDGGSGKVKGVRLKNIKTGDLSELTLDGIFVAIGHEPNTSLFKGQLELTERGFIKATETATSIPGVFAAGDVQDEKYKQAITASGAGCMAALNAQWFLDEHDQPAETPADAKVVAAQSTAKESTPPTNDAGTSTSSVVPPALATSTASSP